MLLQKMKEDIPKLLVIALVVATVGGMTYFIKDGVEDYKDAKSKYEQIYSTYLANTNKASRITQIKTTLEQKKEEWKWTETSIPLAYYVEGGTFFIQFGELLKKHKVTNVSITPLGTEIGFINGHLRAVAYNVRISGPFLNVYNVLYEMENIKSPVEIKPVKISSSNNGETVTVESNIVLYSLNPPNKFEIPTTQTGRADPFFNSEMAEKLLKLQLEQEQKQQQESQQGQPQQQSNSQGQQTQQEQQTQQGLQGQQPEPEQGQKPEQQIQNLQNS